MSSNRLDVGYEHPCLVSPIQVLFWITMMTICLCLIYNMMVDALYHHLACTEQGLSEVIQVFIWFFFSICSLLWPSQKLLLILDDLLCPIWAETHLQVTLKRAPFWWCAWILFFFLRDGNNYLEDGGGEGRTKVKLQRRIGGLDVNSLHIEWGYELHWDLVTNFETISLSNA